ncbi:MAG TPA: Rrf2 family transcriptional regulator [Terriglobales bacterium]|nr:Rrf2 family transcriptional regulator [Terriglobales bacterium]
MLKLTKKADYGLIAVKHLAECSGEGSCRAKDIAEAYSIPLEALAKILQRLVKAGLLHSHQGMNGGYALAREPQRITALEVIRAIDGPLFITSCLSQEIECYQSPKCTVREPLRKVNQSIEQVLGRITISDLAENGSVPADMEKEKPARELVGIASASR